MRLAGADGSAEFVTQKNLRAVYKLIYGEFANLIQHPDLAILSGQAPDLVYIALNVGNGTFAAPLGYSFGPDVASINDIATADFNGDSRPDLISPEAEASERLCSSIDPVSSFPAR